MPLTMDLQSLRGKITGGYLALVFAIFGLGTIAFLDLLFLESRISESAAVTIYKDTVLEMRREEKNIFLYSDTDAHARADAHAASLLAFLSQHADTLAPLTEPGAVSALSADIENYRNSMTAWVTAPVDARPQLQEMIGRNGQNITATAESIAQKQRLALEEAVKQSRWFLLVSLMLIGLATLVIGRRLRRVAVRPLRAMEASMAPIAEGGFDQLVSPSPDREFVTLTDAFNRMLRELEIRRKRMLHSDKLASLGILSAGVAHELNNPLSNISSSCQLLMEELEEADTQTLRKWLEQIDSETERGRKIVRTLLDFGSKRVFSKETHKLSRIIEETGAILGKSLSRHGVALDIDVPAELAVAVDKQRMQQLFINLLQNAMNAADGQLTIRIEARVREAAGMQVPDAAEVAGDIKCLARREGSLVEIRVSDTGPGIKPDALSKVFDPFYTTSEPGHGTGLGLFIVQEIVREHDGCLAIESIYGEETSVIILLPLEERPDA